MAHVGAYLAARREAMGLTQEGLADLLGVSDRIVRDWEKGKHEPKIGVMRRLLHTLHGAWEDIDRLLADDVDGSDAAHLAHLRGDQPPIRLTPNEQRLLDVVRKRELSPEQEAALIAFLRPRANQG